jgi:hypothetical protein
MVIRRMLKRGISKVDVVWKLDRIPRIRDACRISSDSATLTAFKLWNLALAATIEIHPGE